MAKKQPKKTFKSSPSFADQVAEALGFAKSKADLGTRKSNPKGGRQFKSQDERADEFNFKRKTKPVSERIFKKKK
jgi:hypothetical protein